MARFFRLVKNEYLKIILKVSTWIMLALVVLAALGLSVLATVVRSDDYRNSASYQNYVTNYVSSEREYLKASKPEGYEQQLEKLDFMEKAGINPADWRFDLVSEIMPQIEALQQMEGQQEEAQRLMKSNQAILAALEKNDWKAFCQAKIDAIEANPALSKEQKDEAKWEYAYRMEQGVSYEQDDWKNGLITEVAGLKSSVNAMEQQLAAGQPVDMELLQSQKDNLALGQYRLEHNISVDTSERMTTTGNVNFWSVFNNSTSLIQVISVLIIVIAGSCVASEFSGGTIKFLLINPVKRGKILMSKYMATITFSYVMLILFYIVNALFAMLFFGAGDLSAPYLTVVDGTVHSSSAFLHVAWQYLLGSANMVVMATLAFAISSLVRSSALAIGVGVFAMLAGNTAVLFLKNMLNMDWARYIIFANTDLNAVLEGTTAFANQSITFALVTIAIYMVVFLLTAWDGFVRREV